MISAKNQGYPTTARFVKALWEGDYESLKGNPPEHFVNVQDDARLHTIALTDPAVQGERIFAAAAPFNMNSIVAVLRKLYPQREFADYPEGGEDVSTFEGKDRAAELLKRAYGMGFATLEESVRGNAADLVAA